MITQAEIEAVASDLDLHTSFVQRDYVHGWLLSHLFGKSPLGNRLILKGGNSLRKGYFENFRYSRDLDFSMSSSISDEELGRELNLICASLGPATGINFATDRTRVIPKRGADSDEVISEARLYFSDFYGIESELILSVRLDVTQFDRLHLAPQTRQLVHPYSDWEACSTSIRCAKLEEILASKMRCLLQRRHIADLFDLVFPILSGRIEVDRRELLSTFFAMTVFGRSPGVLKALFVDLPLEALRQFWIHITCPSPSRLSFGDAMTAFRQLVEELLPGMPIRDQSSTFFTSVLRNPIIAAGESLTLLRLRYAGVSRLVEPYLLAFKTRQDGVAREYLYAYDTTGGSSGPGIKSFVPGRVASIEGTNIPFTPRMEVELRKAGGSETATRFTGSPGPLRTSAGGRRSGRGRLYQVQCSYCNKRFSRSQPGTRLNPHKDKYGNRCHGRFGLRI